MKKIQGLESRWSLSGTLICIEHLTRVSSEYFTSSVLPSLTSTAGRASHVLLAYCNSEASLMLVPPHTYTPPQRAHASIET
jgi:hypothetical protein